MRLTINGKPPGRLKRPVVREAARKYASILLPPDKYRLLNLTIDFLPLTEFVGEAYYRQPEKHNYRYTIRLDNQVGARTCLMCLGHEMVHIKQYVTKEYFAIDVPNPQKVRWHGEWLSISDHEYYDQPWEIEAHGRETGLYYKMINGLVDEGVI